MMHRPDMPMAPQAGSGGLGGQVAAPLPGTVGAEDDAGGEEQATPEEQAQYEQIIDNGLKLIYDKQSMPGVVEALGGDGDPIDGLATVAAGVLGQLERSATEAGKPLDPVVLYHAGIALLEDLADLAGRAGVHTYTEEEAGQALERMGEVWQAEHGQQQAGQQQAGQGQAMPPSAPAAAPQPAGLG